MKRINILFFKGLMVLLSLFCISSSGWAQTNNPEPLRESLAQMGQRVRQPEPAPAREQAGFGDMRIDWRKLGLSE